MIRDRCQSSLRSLCDSSRGWRDVNILKARGSQAPLREGNVQEPRRSLGASGQRPPPTGQDWSPATQRRLPRALDAGTRPGAERHIWSPHAARTRPAGK